MVLSWFLLAPLTALPVLAGSSDADSSRLLAEVLGLAVLGIALGLVAPGRLGGAAPWVAVGVIAPIVPVVGLPWTARAGLEAGAWLVAIGLVGTTLRAARRERSLPRHAVITLVALATLALQPLSLGVVLLAAPLGWAGSRLEASGLTGKLGSLVLTLASGLVVLVSSRVAILDGHQLAAPLQRVGAELLAMRPAPARPALDAPPIVVLSVDTLRADTAEGMVAHQALRARGASWTTAMATSSWTVPSLVSLWTGASPGTHGGGAPAGGRRVFTRRDPTVPHLAEELRAAGYTTAAFVTNPLVTPELGLADGFSTWRHATATPPHPLPLTGWRASGAAEDGERVVARARSWLASAPNRGFLLWVHLFDPHIPYTHAADPWIARHAAEPDAAPALRDAARAAYAAEASAADRALTGLLDDLEARRFWDHGGVVVLTSDHGEEFWEHGGFEHGHSHHGEVTDIPLVLAGAAVVPGERSQPASIADVAPTLRRVAGISATGPDLRTPGPDERVVTATGNLHGPHMQSARSADLRVILGPDGLHAWDLRTDPGERTPTRIAEDHPLAVAARDARPPAGEAADVETEQLRVLGYVD